MKKIAFLLISMILISGCTSNSEPTKAGAIASLYFVADTPRGFKLFSEQREFPETENLGQDVISDLVSGKIVPLDPNYVNLWGAKNTVNSITASDSVATIDLGTISLNVGAESEERAIEQIVWTFLEINTAIKAVRFTVNGNTVESFAGHVDTTREFTKSPGYDVLNPLQISSITEGETLTNPITIFGQACTFEANVYWRLSQDGNLVKDGSTTAGAACPERSAWSVALDTLDPGSYRFEVIEYSAEDGSLFAIDDKNFSVK